MDQEKHMRQRYFISKEGKENSLVIREYALTGKDRRNISGMVPLEDDYTFLCQENYRGAAIQDSISNGSLIATLRTANLFPIGQLAVKLAESVTALYGYAEDRSTELFFDDIELFAHS
jgi:hypothetical protein